MSDAACSMQFLVSCSQAASRIMIAWVPYRTAHSKAATPGSDHRSYNLTEAKCGFSKQILDPSEKVMTIHQKNRAICLTYIRRNVTMSSCTCILTRCACLTHPERHQPSPPFLGQNTELLVRPASIKGVSASISPSSAPVIRRAISLTCQFFADPRCESGQKDWEMEPSKQKTIEVYSIQANMRSINQSINQSINPSIHRSIDQTNKHTNKQTSKQPTNQPTKQTNKQRNKQTNNQPNKQTNKLTNKQTNIHACMHAYVHILWICIYLLQGNDVGIQSLTKRIIPTKKCSQSQPSPSKPLQAALPVTTSRLSPDFTSNAGPAGPLGTGFATAAWGMTSICEIDASGKSPKRLWCKICKW